ncbi:MAG: Response regulator MprA [Synergistetes bacterium ADurb.Bin520]|nr:MAG: Response regulator MprA [Synergistetes bacterium ADurb.Bin520]
MAKILVVDDAPVVRLLLQNLLRPMEDKGVELLFADDGHEALSVIKKERPTLVFLDIMMAGKSGYDVCETVKKVWGFDDVHIVFLTSRIHPSDRERGSRAGGEGHIAKPFDPEEILAKVREFIPLD